MFIEITFQSLKSAVSVSPGNHYNIITWLWDHVNTQCTAVIAQVCTLLVVSYMGTVLLPTTLNLLWLANKLAWHPPEIKFDSVTHCHTTNWVLLHRFWTKSLSCFGCCWHGNSQFISHCWSCRPTTLINFLLKYRHVTWMIILIECWHTPLCHRQKLPLQGLGYLWLSKRVPCTRWQKLVESFSSFQFCLWSWGCGR